MIQIDLLEKALIEYSQREGCNDGSCPECKEIQQPYDSYLILELVNGIVQELKPASYHQDILQTFYIGFKLGRDIEKSNHS